MDKCGCCKKAPEVGPRPVYANELELNSVYRNNKVTNSKYTFLSFLPKNLFEQFSKFMNAYFVLIAVLQLWAAITPVNPITTWLPLAAIFGLSAIKEGVDDYYRHKADRRFNSRLFDVVRDGSVAKIMSKDIHVGDVILLHEDVEIPADCVALKSSTADTGKVFIETANIDGETDLKTKTSLPCTQELDEVAIFGFKGVIECAVPNADIHEFDSRLRLTVDAEEVHALTSEQLLLQGTFVRNTDWVYGCVVYTGNETKLGNNKTTPKTKWTKLDRRINRTSVFIFCFQVSMILIFGILGQIWSASNGTKMAYLGFLSAENEPWYTPVVIPLRFMLLMSYMIPISLKVTLDIVKFYYARIISYDLEMYDAETDTPANALNTAISEDLGQIEYICTDKTGTLTENIMNFRKCAIDGTVFGEGPASDVFEDEVLRQNLRAGDEPTHAFFRCLALNHTVTPGPPDEDGNVTLRCESPDEEALVRAAASVGITFASRVNRELELDFMGVLERYELLTTLAFSSDRRRMSVVVRNRDTDQITLFVKGADDVVIERLRDDQDPSVMQEQANGFARRGLRTLAIAYRLVDQYEYEEWAVRLRAAESDMNRRKAAVEAMYAEMERDLLFVGVTAIEDKLQDQVPETIATLRRAGIKFWMLTGDKFGTAKQVATACNLYSPAPAGILIHVQESDDHVSLNQHLAGAQAAVAKGQTVSVIIRGRILGIFLPDDTFLELCLLAHAVIFCRVTPLQKGQIVERVMRTGSLCLAIGDGGNDVDMIRKAQVGVGIAGREGLHAARAADYAFGRFKFLKRLLLVHGRYSYQRTSFIAQYAFYKSLYIAFCQIFFNFFTGFSGTSHFNTFALTMYNVVFTGLPIFGYAMDKDVAPEVVYRYPQLYRAGQRSTSYSIRTMAWWFIMAVFHAAVSLLFVVGAFGVAYHHWGDGSPMDYDSISMVTYTTIVFVNSGLFLLNEHTVNVVNHFLLWGVLVAYFVMTTMYALVPFLEFHQVMIRLFVDPVYWGTAIVSSVVCLLPVYVVKYVQRQYFPTLANDLRYLASLSKERRTKLARESNFTSRYSTTISSTDVSSKDTAANNRI